ncbi:hypothetical protein P0136_03160 [Lentisphaerota bacterium ZTH]|nr:hypothetical protein JYG24_05705 [Lentisphaerota bacterium]WET07001.1 hypothetical protein P0136_03160 [Lentisphaerota bacterium ZTH]
MKRSLSIAFLFVVVFILSLISRAERCELCKVEIIPDQDDSYNVDWAEFELRQMYLDKIKEYITSKHSTLIDSNELLTMDVLCELFNIPARDFIYEDKQTYNLLVHAENELQAKRMDQSIGNALTYERVRPDIRETLPELRFDDGWFAEILPENATLGFARDFPEIETKTLCESCAFHNLTLSYNEDIIRGDVIKIPHNIQMALKLHKVVQSSNIIILLDKEGAADSLMLSYLNLFNNERFVLGLDAYDESPDWSDPKLNDEVAEVVWKSINDACEDDFPADLSRLITEFGLPVLTFDKYYSATRLEYDSDACIRDNLVSFLETRCPNAVCFGVSTAVTHLRDHDSKYDKLVEENYNLIKLAFEELFGINKDGFPSVDRLKTAAKSNLTGNWAYLFMRTKAVRSKVVDKICNYYKSINKSSKKGIPFILLLNEDYGVVFDQFENDTYMLKKYNKAQKEALIQNLIKDKLSDLGYDNLKIVTFYVCHGAQVIFSKEKNDLLEDFCLDYFVQAELSTF